MTFIDELHEKTQFYCIGKGMRENKATTIWIAMIPKIGNTYFVSSIPDGGKLTRDEGTIWKLAVFLDDEGVIEIWELLPTVTQGEKP